MSAYTNIVYHTLEDPLNPKQLPNKYSDLHTLYPGRPMDSMDNPNRYSIQHEDPEAAAEMFQEVKEKTASYGSKLEKKARKLGGDEKMTVHAIEDPSMITEDPNLKETNMLNPDTTPLLMPVDPRLPGENTNVEGSRKPLIENYSSEEKQPKNNNSYRWILLVLGALAAIVFAYFYATRQIDIYSF